MTSSTTRDLIAAACRDPDSLRRRLGEAMHAWVRHHRSGSGSGGHNPNNAGSSSNPVCKIRICLYYRTIPRNGIIHIPINDTALVASLAQQTTRREFAPSAATTCSSAAQPSHPI